MQRNGVSIKTGNAVSVAKKVRGDGGCGSPLSSQDSDWKELRDWTSDMLPRVL